MRNAVIRFVEAKCFASKVKPPEGIGSTLAHKTSKFVFLVADGTTRQPLSGPSADTMRFTSYIAALHHFITTFIKSRRYASATRATTRATSGCEISSRRGRISPRTTSATVSIHPLRNITVAECGCGDSTVVKKSSFANHKANERKTAGRTGRYASFVEVHCSSLKLMVPL